MKTRTQNPASVPVEYLKLTSKKAPGPKAPRAVDFFPPGAEQPAVDSPLAKHLNHVDMGAPGEVAKREGVAVVTVRGRSAEEIRNNIGSPGDGRAVKFAKPGTVHKDNPAFAAMDEEIAKRGGPGSMPSPKSEPSHPEDPEAAADAPAAKRTSIRRELSQAGRFVGGPLEGLVCFVKKSRLPTEPGTPPQRAVEVMILADEKSPEHSNLVEELVRSICLKFSMPLTGVTFGAAPERAVKEALPATDE